jgi:hypothetical protein
MKHNHSRDVTQAIKEAIVAWREYFQTSLSQESSEQQIAQLMSGIARDDAWIPYGGSGRHSRFYLIDDYLQARFDFDHNDLLQSYSVYETKEGWLKDPQGILLSGSAAPDAELLIPSVSSQDK